MNRKQPKTSRKLPAISDFIRNATPEEKERVYMDVMGRADERQRMVLDKAAESVKGR